MGFLDSLLGGMIEAGVGATEDKYRQMSLSDLEREWNSVFAHKGFPADPNYDLELAVSSNSPNGVLDRIYAERTGRPSWRQKALQRQREAQQEERKKQQRAIEKENQEAKRKETARKASQEANSFKERLATSDMAKIIIEKIDSIGEKAKYIAVFPDRVIINSNDGFLESFAYEDDEGLDGLDDYDYLCEIKYKKYKYPPLSKSQCIILRVYIEETAKMKYRFVENRDQYEHKDYYGCLELVEDDEEGMRDSW